jgi:transposase
MHLSDQDLRQLDDHYLGMLTPDQARALPPKVIADLRAARERLAQTPSTSSRPPSSHAPWEGIDEAGEADDGTPPAPDAQEAEAPAADQRSTRARTARRKGTAAAGKPGRRKGASGHGCTETVPIDAEQVHAPQHCAASGRAVDGGGGAHAYDAHYTHSISSGPRAVPARSFCTTPSTSIWSSVAVAGTGRSRHAAGRKTTGRWR